MFVLECFSFVPVSRQFFILILTVYRLIKFASAQSKHFAINQQGVYIVIVCCQCNCTFAISYAETDVKTFSYKIAYCRTYRKNFDILNITHIYACGCAIYLINSLRSAGIILFEVSSIIICTILYRVITDYNPVYILKP